MDAAFVAAVTAAACACVCDALALEIAEVIRSLDSFRWGHGALKTFSVPNCRAEASCARNVHGLAFMMRIDHRQKLGLQVHQRIDGTINRLPAPRFSPTSLCRRSLPSGFLVYPAEVTESHGWWEVAADGTSLSPISRWRPVAIPPRANLCHRPPLPVSRLD